MERNLKEFNKLEQYLISKNIPYKREDEEHDLGHFVFDRHQLIVKDENDKILWDAICHYGSYGCESGLLEIAGSIAPESDVIGWLTADDVIARIENKNNWTPEVGMIIKHNTTDYVGIIVCIDYEGSIYTLWNDNTIEKDIITSITAFHHPISETDAVNNLYKILNEVSNENK